MKIKPERKKDYIDIHKKVNIWPEVLDNIKNAGIKKMKIYILENYAICYMEAENINAAFKYLGEQPIQRKWNEATADFMDTQPDYDSKEVVKTLNCIFDFYDKEQY